MQQQSIQQINLSYDPQQDRLLMKAAVSQSQEIQMWITYRIAREIFKVFNREAHLPVSTPASLEHAQSLTDATHQFEQEAEAMQQLHDLDFSTAYQQRSSMVGEALLLVSEVRFVSLNDRLSNMQLVCANGANVNMGLNPQLVLAISRMLMIASEEASWLLAAPKEPEAVSSILLEISTDKQVLH